MTNLLVLDLANSLKPEEAAEFRIFLRSEYFNREVNVAELESLFEIIQEAVQEGSLDALGKDQIYALVFPGKPLIRNKLEKLASDLNKQFKYFFLTRQYFSPENEPKQQLDWLKELRRRGLANRHKHALEKAKKDKEKSSVESLESYFLQHIFAEEEHEWQSVYNNKSDQKIPELIRRLDNYYFVYHTELLNRLLLLQNHAKLEPSVLEIIQAPWEVPKSNLDECSLLQIKLAIHVLLKDENPSTSDWQKLLETFKSQEEFLNPEEIKSFYTYLRNLCVIFIDLGHLDFLPVLHELRKDNLDRGYFYFDGKILPNACIGITQGAIKIGAIDWARAFVEAHKDKIFGDGEAREYYRLNMAICLYAEKKYSEALDLISFEAAFSTYHLIARRLELKIYYEMHSELLLYKIDAFSMFIRRTGQKVFSKEQYELNLNFANFLRQLSLSADISDPSRSVRIIQRMNAKKKLGERQWLLQMAAALGGRKKVQVE